MTDSIQCKAMLACFDKLVLALKADPLIIWNELAAKGLIPPPDGQIEAQQLAQRILDLVKVEPARYDDIVNLLSKHDWLNDIIEILQTILRDSIKSTEWTERSHGSVHMHQDPIRSKLQNFSGPHPIPTPRKSFSCMNMVQEKLKSENKSLQANLSRVMERMDTMRTENEDLRNNLDKANAQVVTTICSFERQELDYRGKIARLEEQVRQMQLEYTDPEMSKRGKQLPIVKRFVDTLGRIRELETLTKGLEEQRSQVQQDCERLREENKSLRTVENQSTTDKREIDKLRAEQSRLCEELEHARGDLENKRAQERQLTEQLHSYEGQLAEKTSAAEQLQRQLRAQFESTQQDKNNEATELQHQYTSMKKRLDEATSEKDNLQTAVHKLTGEKKQLDMAIKEYRTESGAILNDYAKAVAELKQTKDENDELQQLLTKCNQELNQQRERCIHLEKLEKELRDKILYMSEQLELYKYSIKERKFGATNIVMKHDEVKEVKSHSKECHSRSESQGYSQALAEIKVLKEEKDHLQAMVQQLAGDRDQLYKEKKKIEGERSQLQEAVGKYSAESKSLLEEYADAVDKLQLTKDEKENLQQALIKCNHDRMDLRDTVYHMDVQLKLHREDFERERRAHEIAIIVKNFAEDRIKKMEREMKDLRDRLQNQQGQPLRATVVPPQNQVPTGQPIVGISSQVNNPPAVHHQVAHQFSFNLEGMFGSSNSPAAFDDNLGRLLHNCKRLCATPGCNFKGLPELNGLCIDCYQGKFNRRY